MQEEYPEPDFQKRKWYHTKKALVIALLTLGPLALPLLWLNPRYSARTKVLWTVLLVGLTYALGALTSLVLNILMDQLGFSQ